MCDLVRDARGRAMPLTADRLRKQLREIHVVFVCNIDGLFAGLPPRILHALRVTE